MIYFPIDKILPIRTQDYVGPGIDVNRGYSIVGVHGYSLNNLAIRVPVNAEVVTDLRFSTSGIHDFFSGTALIPKTSRFSQEER